MTKRVTVIVEGCKYVVEVGDLRERPIQATVNQRTYQVQLPTPGEMATSSEVDSPEVVQIGIDEVDCPSITAPMPGDILEIHVKVGMQIEPGDLVCVLEAMKMKNMIRSGRSGVIASVDVNPGESVDYGAVLVTFE